MNGIPARTKPRQCRAGRSRPACVRPRARSVGFAVAVRGTLEFDLPPPTGAPLPRHAAGALFFAGAGPVGVKGQANAARQPAPPANDRAPGGHSPMNAFSAWRGGSSAQRTKQRNGSRVALVPVLEPPPASVADATTTRSEAQEDLGELTCKFNVRQFTPRHMAELSLELYVLGYIDWDEYAMLAFQSELHPDFDRTIGALTGEKADPDRPRDFLSLVGGTVGVRTDVQSGRPATARSHPSDREPVPQDGRADAIGRRSRAAPAPHSHRALVGRGRVRRERRSRDFLRTAYALCSGATNIV